MSKLCDEKTEVFSRVVGYFSPINQWNKGKQSEFKDRKVFTIKKEVKGDAGGSEGRVSEIDKGAKEEV